MLSISTEERLALLLNVLGNEAEAAALKSMNPTRAVYVSKLLDEYKQDPPTDAEVDFIVQDFSKFFSFALQTLAPNVEAAEKATKQKAQNKTKKRKAKTAVGKEPEMMFFEPIQPTGDWLSDLNRLNAFQIASVLSEDHPKIISLVVGQLKTTLGAAVIEALDIDIRGFRVHSRLK